MNSEDFITSVLPSHIPPAGSRTYVNSGDSGLRQDDELQTKAVYVPSSMNVATAFLF